MAEENKQRNKKIIISAAVIVLTVILVAFWGVLAYIKLNSSDSGQWGEGVEARFIAHRGYSLKYFQNTLQAFQAAGQESFFQGIETDVRMTKDGVFVCSHDDNPFVDKSILISQSNYQDIKALPLDLTKAEEGVNISEPYRIALFSEYLNTCLYSRKIAIIELKVDFSKEISKTISDLVAEKLNYRQYVFCSFYKDVLDNIHKERKYVNIQLFTSKSVKAFFYTKMGYNIGVDKKLLKSDKRIKRAHKADVWIGAYTVNDENEAKRLISMGVDWITTDRVLEIA